ncbi:hypothetical protein SAMN05661096_00640 [Marivirga sericea]|jgi:hypothetical protein|uniref:YceI-like domain-containing protein n=1 Tax=Marivirga sericea TaxID=1028 RepID=A0A1X7IHR3_9BACT|nr:hypothetical protein [Marivirga sericea]SMG13964.1 hypothetical protein SAMN05661096_00640 [Marivirga sericea]
MKIIFITLLFFAQTWVAVGQSLYRTTEGHIVMVAEINNERIIAESHKLFLFLDYNTKEISGKLELKTIDTGIGYLNEQISNADGEELIISFSGFIPVEDFISKPHAPISFNWPLKVTAGESTFQIVLSGNLKHFNGGEAIACMLSATGEVSTTEVGLKSMLPEISEILKIQFTQVILRKNEL